MLKWVSSSGPHQTPFFVFYFESFPFPLPFVSSHNFLFAEVEKGTILFPLSVFFIFSCYTVLSYRRSERTLNACSSITSISKEFSCIILK
ncbi:hypothetical protein F5050DRAFT_336965 [Lentinula boryana]|uniref:Uncharacterized protein n=1 Tax=Lentinula boryana TaxID=40481 RepID=A0ABQ8Q9Q0_9AGAR|nr:hypothetical protein F5050DRAFT_336965 [Lentinula boryana]